RLDRARPPRAVGVLLPEEEPERLRDRRPRRVDAGRRVDRGRRPGRLLHAGGGAEEERDDQAGVSLGFAASFFLRLSSAFGTSSTWSSAFLSLSLTSSAVRSFFAPASASAFSARSTDWSSSSCFFGTS